MVFLFNQLIEITLKGSSKYKYPHDYDNFCYFLIIYQKVFTNKRNEKKKPAYLPTEYGVEGRLKIDSNSGKSNYAAGGLLEYLIFVIKFVAFSSGEHNSQYQYIILIAQNILCSYNTF